jgi:hypothetical protein
MPQRRREQLLRGTLILVGLVSLLAICPLVQWWPSGWRWHPYNPAYEHMIIGVYATLGLFLLLAARRPERHRSLVLFAGWSSLVHGAVMAMHAARSAAERQHFAGDVPALFLAGILLLLLAPAPEVRGAV